MVVARRSLRRRGLAVRAVVQVTQRSLVRQPVARNSREFVTSELVILGCHSQAHIGSFSALCSVLQVLDRKFTRQRVFNLEVQPPIACAAAVEAILLDLRLHCDIGQLLATARVAFDLFKRLLHLFYVLDRVQMVREVAREERLWHCVLAKFHLDKETVRGRCCSIFLIIVLLVVCLRLQWLEVLRSLLERALVVAYCWRR